MLQFLKAPETNYTNPFDIARFKLAWQIAVFTFSGLTFFIVALLLTIGPAFIFPTASGMLITIVAIAVMKVTRKHTVASLIYVIFGTTIVNSSLFFFPAIHNLPDYIWIVNIIIYSFFALGKKRGLMVLLVNFISLSVYIIFFVNDNISVIQPLGLANKIALIIGTTVCLSVLSFILYVFVSTTNAAEAKYAKFTLELQKKNEEKDVLLKEVHHRVKNNLQVIISLMRLKSAINEHGDGDTDTIDRIRAMSLIHEKIYQSADLAKIDLSVYLKDLIADLINSHAVDTKINYTIKSTVKVVKMKSLVPLALIFNELISNSIKHAFQARDTGDISINLTENATEFKLIYADNGTWQKASEKETLGLELIESLSAQLSGEHQLSTNNGTIYTFVFKREP